MNPILYSYIYGTASQLYFTRSRVFYSLAFSLCLLFISLWKSYEGQQRAAKKIYQQGKNIINQTNEYAANTKGEIWITWTYLDSPAYPIITCDAILSSHLHVHTGTHLHYVVLL